MLPWRRDAVADIDDTLMLPCRLRRCYAAATLLRYAHVLLMPRRAAFACRLLYDIYFLLFALRRYVAPLFAIRRRCMLMLILRRCCFLLRRLRHAFDTCVYAVIITMLLNADAVAMPYAIYAIICCIDDTLMS